MASNPNPKRISAAAWRFWEEFYAHEPTAEMSGIYADKAGYHNYRNALPSSDYSVEEVANDRKGSGEYAAGVDIKLPTDKMKLYSKRLQKAFQSKDKRLYIDGEPATREFIGTIDGVTVYCYMLTGGAAQGVGADSGVDWGRDSSHLWHLHHSIIRGFAAEWQIYSGLLSIMKNEAYEDWEFAPMSEQNVIDALNSEAGQLALQHGLDRGMQNEKAGNANETYATMLKHCDEIVKEVKTVATGISEDLSALGSALEAQLAEINDRLTALEEAHTPPTEG